MSTLPRADLGLGLPFADLHRLKSDFDRRRATGSADVLPGNAAFLNDGRVLCRERARGDSRYVYGRNGFHFWVNASGYMHANLGRLFMFLPAHHGHEPNIAFFAGARLSGGRFAPLSLLPVPFLSESENVVQERYAVIGHDATYFVTETAELASVVRAYLDQTDPDDPRILFSIVLENRAGRELELYLSGYFNPLCRHQFYETSEDCWFKRIHVQDAQASTNPGGDAGRLPPYIVNVHEDLSRLESMTHTLAVQRALTLSVAPSEARRLTQTCTSRRGYTGGPRRGIAQAAFLTTGSFDEPVPLTVFNDNAVVGDLFRFRLPEGAEARCDYALAFVRPEDPSPRPIDARSVDAAHARVIREQTETPHGLHLTVRGCTLDGIADDTFNHFAIYLRRQVEVCAETRGFMQPAPRALIGVRDVCQAIEGHLFDQPAASRDKLREVLGRVLVDGRCPRQYALPVGGTTSAADLREFIDQGSWVVSTLYSYCTTTGDLDLLDEVHGYHRAHPKLADMLIAADDSDSTVQHLLRIMDYLDRQRDPQSGLLRALYGDWNDALDGLGIPNDPRREFGDGVSVMASLHYYRNCAEMIALLEHHAASAVADHVARFQHIRRELRDGLLKYAVVHQDGSRRILHGWGDARSYCVGGFSDSDGAARDGLTANAFWVLCGMMAEDPSLRPDILLALDRLDSPYGLKTFEPGFARGTAGVGRIANLPIGTAENAATYVHATLFGIMALFAMNEPRRAWQQIHKTLPFSPHQQGISHSPFVMPNSYLHNPNLRLTGQSMNDWQTGSSNALLKTLVWYVAGFRPGLDSLRIAPATWCPFSGFELAVHAHSRRVRIVYKQDGGGERRFLLNDELLAAGPGNADGIPYVDVAYSLLTDTGDNVISVLDPE